MWDQSGSSCATARLKRRAQFLRVGKGRRWHGVAMTIQTEARAESEGEHDAALPRFGFTLTKKVGNAVVRNRARRRLREAVRLTAGLPVKAGYDYVIVGRIEAVRMPMEALGLELAKGLSAVHERGKRRDKFRSQAGSANPPADPIDTPRRSAPEGTRSRP